MKEHFRFFSLKTYRKREIYSSDQLNDDELSEINGTLRTSQVDVSELLASSLIVIWVSATILCPLLWNRKAAVS